MNRLYPEIKPFRTDRLRVSSTHTLYIEESGNPNGQPIVCLHGGPGSNSKPHYRRFFNPQKYRIVLFDQRGCGKSTPFGEISNNTTQDLIADIELLRKYLKIDRWVVCGGSWGSALGLVYAQSHPKRVKGIILRGIFTFRQQEVDWLFEEISKLIYPDIWEYYSDKLSVKKGVKFSSVLYKLLNSKRKSDWELAVRTFGFWNRNRLKLISNVKSPKDIPVDTKEILSMKILLHYVKNRGFLKEGQLLKNISKIRHIPSIIIHGRYDMITPMATAWELHRTWPEADFHIVSDAGHHSSEPGIIDKLISATDSFFNLK